MTPQRITYALLDFGRPVLEQLAPEASLEATRAAVGTVVTVWNACVLAGPAWRDGEALEQLQTLAESGYLPSPLNTLLGPLVARHAERHTADARVIADWVAEPAPDGGLLLHCKVQLPGDSTAHAG